MLPLAAAAAAAATGRPLVRLQPSRSSSQLSLEGLPCGVVSPAGSSGGRVGSGGGLRHSASYSNLQVRAERRRLGAWVGWWGVQ